MKAKLFFNPFRYVAGWTALGIGLVIMAITALAGWANGVMFDGALDIHTARHTLSMAFQMQGVAFLSLMLCMWAAGAIFSKTQYRVVDVVGTVAFARAPMMILALLAFLPIMPERMDSFGMVCFTVLAVLAVAWMVALLYNGYTVCFNMRGLRSALSFIGGILSAEVVSKLAIAFLLFGPVQSKAADPASTVIPAGQTINQTTEIVVKALENGDYNTVFAYFDNTMRKAVSVAKLKMVWETTSAQLGGFVKADTSVSAQNYKEYQVLIIPCTFKSGVMSLQLTFNGEGYISGLFLK